MDPVHARIAAQRGARDMSPTGYSSSAYGSDGEEVQTKKRVDLNSKRKDLLDRDDSKPNGDQPGYSGGPRGSAF